MYSFATSADSISAYTFPMTSVLLVPEQSAHNGHGQTIIQGENRK